MEFAGRLMNQSKATPLRVPMNSLAMIASLSITLPKTRSNRCADLARSCRRMSAASAARTLVDREQNHILAGKDEQSLLFSVHPVG